MASVAVGLAMVVHVLSLAFLASSGSNKPIGAAVAVVSGGAGLLIVWGLRSLLRRLSWRPALAHGLALVPTLGAVLFLGSQVGASAKIMAPALGIATVVIGIVAWGHRAVVLGAWTMLVVLGGWLLVVVGPDQRRVHTTVTALDAATGSRVWRTGLDLSVDAIGGGSSAETVFFGRRDCLRSSAEVHVDASTGRTRSVAALGPWDAPRAATLSSFWSDKPVTVAGNVVTSAAHPDGRADYRAQGATGATVWTRSFSSQGSHPPALAAVGHGLVGIVDEAAGRLHIVDGATGVDRWTIPYRGRVTLGTYEGDTPVLLGDAIALVTDDAITVHDLRTGRVLSSTRLPSAASNSPGLGWARDGSGRVVVADWDLDRVVMIDRSHTRAWSHPMDLEIYAQIVIDGSRVVVASGGAASPKGCGADGGT